MVALRRTGDASSKDGAPKKGKFALNDNQEVDDISFFSMSGRYSSNGAPSTEYVELGVI